MIFMANGIIPFEENKKYDSLLSHDGIKTLAFQAKPSGVPPIALGGGRLAPPCLYLLKSRPFVAMGDVGFDNRPGNGSLFQESAKE